MKSQFYIILISCYLLKSVMGLAQFEELESNIKTILENRRAVPSRPYPSFSKEKADLKNAEREAVTLDTVKKNCNFIATGSQNAQPNLSLVRAMTLDEHKIFVKSIMQTACYAKNLDNHGTFEDLYPVCDVYKNDIRYQKHMAAVYTIFHTTRALHLMLENVNRYQSDFFNRMHETNFWMEHFNIRGKTEDYVTTLQPHVMHYIQRRQLDVLLTDKFGWFYWQLNLNCLDVSRQWSIRNPTENKTIDCTENDYARDIQLMNTAMAMGCPKAVKNIYKIGSDYLIEAADYFDITRFELTDAQGHTQYSNQSFYRKYGHRSSFKKNMIESIKYILPQITIFLEHHDKYLGKIYPFEICKTQGLQSHLTLKYYNRCSKNDYGIKPFTSNHLKGVYQQLQNYPYGNFKKMAENNHRCLEMDKDASQYIDELPDDIRIIFDQVSRNLSANKIH